jgi:hypothetical protein
MISKRSRENFSKSEKIQIQSRIIGKFNDLKGCPKTPQKMELFNTVFY